MFQGECVIGNESLIPFGLHIEADQLVDVASVPRGSKCGCICPSCRTPLIARQGEAKEWHFAHRSRNVHNDTKRDCEYSFAVSVRLMIRQLSTSGLKFRTPKFEDSLEAHSQVSHQSHKVDFVIAEETSIVLTNVQIGATFSHTVVDVLGYVNDIPFVVYVTYKDRTIPPDVNPPNTQLCGVVEVGIGGLLKIFRNVKEGRYIEALREYIEENTEGKSWVYHPRAARARKNAENQVAIWMSRQKPLRSYQTAADPTPKLDSYWQSLPINPQPPNAPKPTIGSFECLVCGAGWSGTSRHCDKCNTHLFTKESNGIEN